MVPPAPGEAPSGLDDPHEAGAFEQDLRAAAERAGLKILDFDSSVLRVEHEREVTRLGTRPLRRRWRALPPDRREDFLFEILTAPQADVFSSSNNTFHEVREALMPRIGPPDLPRYMGFDAAPPSRPLVDAVLHVYIVVDEPATMWFVGAPHLERWGVSFEEAEAQAMANLRRRTQARHIERFSDFPVAQYLTHDSFDASRILLIDEVAAPLPPGGVVAAVPTGDLLYFAPVNEAETQTTLEYLLRLVWRTFPGAAYPVTDRLLWYDGKRWWPLSWTKDGDRVSMNAPEGFLQAIGKDRAVSRSPLE